MSRRPVQIIAHRGASRAERENTLTAFRRAAAMGAHAVELDVRLAADDSLVVHHDAQLEDGRSVTSLRLGEFPDYVTTLGPALEACHGMWVNIEIKSDPREPDFDPQRCLADLVVDLLRGHDDGPERWVISSFDRLMIDRVRGLWPDLPTAWLTLGADGEDIADLAAAGHRALHPYEAYVTPTMVANCHAAGLALNTWTCDDAARMVLFDSWGVDGICTNVPDIAVAALGQVGD